MAMKLLSSISPLVLLFFTVFTVPQIIADLNSDRQALLDFAAAVPHVRKLNWNSSTSICTSWFGISCNSNRTRVVSVRLPGTGLYGTIPPNTIGRLDALTILSLRSNYLSGHLPSDVPSILSLQFLYLQHNNFSGNFPTSVSIRVEILDLSFNSFNGSIPPTIQNLIQLFALFLQNNSFSGTIPSVDLPKLKILNFSYNNFNGSIPTSLQKFSNHSFDGNPLLCRLPLEHCSAISPPPSPSSPTSPTDVSSSPTYSQIHEAAPKKKLGTNSIIAIAVCVFAVLFLIVVVILVCCLKRKDDGSRVLKGKAGNDKPKDFGSGVQEAEKNRLFFFEGCSYNFDLEDLLRASAEVLGRGSYGTAYKAVLEDGTTVVVKRLKEVAVGKKEFEQQMEIISNVGKHPNVAPLRAYYYSKDEKLLVYNYMPTGSFAALLHSNRRSTLDWDTRVKICLSAARGIAHIHSLGGVKFAHGNIKASNVLLSPDLDGLVSDVGLTPLMNFPATISRTAGYRARELIETRKVTHKSDVYSFGVVLLEMLTGKAPVQVPGRDDAVDLPRWVQSVVREEWTAEVFDVELLKYQNIEEEMVQMLQIALSCVTKVADMRPSMDEVVRMMEGIRNSELKNLLSSETESNAQTP